MTYPISFFSSKHLKFSTKMSTTGIKPLQFGGVILQAPEVWIIKTDSYTEPDGRECSMIDICKRRRSLFHHNQLWPYARRF